MALPFQFEPEFTEDENTDRLNDSEEDESGDEANNKRDPSSLQHTDISSVSIFSKRPHVSAHATSSVNLPLKIGDTGLSTECQHLIWMYKKNISSGNQFLQIAAECQHEIIKVPACDTKYEQSGQLLSCLIDHKENITSIPCIRFLTDMEAIIFSDYRLIDRFTESCSYDINNLHCGRLSGSKNVCERLFQALLGQGETINCLSKSTDNLSPDCKQQVFRVNELQSEDFHLDRPLYFACRDDREKFCHAIIAGNHQVYKCLFNHKLERTMSFECKAKLFEKQKIISEDYKVSRKLAQECRQEIHENKCRKHIGRSKIKLVRLSHILLCLEDAKHDGRAISSNCQSEMNEHRQMLLSDYRLSPDLATNCQKDIEKFCKSRLELGGKTIDCLMQHTGRTRKHKNRISDHCRRSLEDLIKVADAGEDWRMDPVLRSACQPVVSVACSDAKGGEGRVLSCLMDHLDSNHMLEECREKLLQIQYFVARDYKLDSKLYRACKENAQSFCHAKNHWWDDPNKMDPERGPLILPCLFRYAYHPMEEKRLSAECAGEVKRVMKQRAVSVRLLPEIEDACLDDLAEFCVDKVSEGEELSCLQQKLTELTPNCKIAVTNFTVEEGEHVELNHELEKHCSGVFQKYCSDLYKDVDEGDLMQCLIENKNHHDVKSNIKCRQSIEHFQLISLKDYHFSAKFKDLCHKDIIEHCPNILSKNEVIYCLSHIYTTDILLETKQSKISHECQPQLRVELLEKNEYIKLDPKLDAACKEDQSKLCANVIPGEGKMVQCLKEHFKKLSSKCHLKIFNREKEEMSDNAVDYILMKSCKRMIKQFCADEDFGQVLNCLKSHRDNEDMDAKCRREIVRRMILQNKDYRLSPTLQKSCVRDIPKFCSHVKGIAEKEEEYEGKVILCLKDQYRKHRLSRECELEIKHLIKDAALDYRQDPILVKACSDEIKEMCSGDKAKSLAPGSVEECLKIKFKNKEINRDECKQQIARILHESRSDIHADPLLYSSCSLDIKHFCVNVPPGEGRQLSCLLTILDSKHAHLNEECQSMLIKRKEMFEYAVVVAPVESFHEIFTQISNSPAKYYFVCTAMFIFGCIFAIGLLFGRVTKRITINAKNK
ncbi:Golgi apparatus protein 1 [Nymphon striatum]|nr:Golgi apparatus protein 1 [Nymphon striatum]